jgi:hypothetical protein
MDIEDIIVAMGQDAETTVTVWSRWPADRWVVERSYPLRYLRDVYGHDFQARMSTADGRGREYEAFPQGFNPNG